MHVKYISCVILDCNQHYVSLPFLFLNSSLGFAGKNITKNNFILIVGFVFQNCYFLGHLPYTPCYAYHFSLFSFGWVVIAVCGYFSIERIS